MTWLWVVIAVAVAAATAAASPPVLRWLGADDDLPVADAPADAATPGETPEAAAADLAPDDDPVDFAALATPRFAVVVGLLALGAGLVAYGTLPPMAWLAWTALVAPGALAVATDGATTWIPYPVSLAMAATATVGVVAWAALAGNPWLLVASAVGALLTGGFFHVFHHLTRGGIGYGDVRLMAVAGAVCAPVSADVGLWAPVLGSVIAAIWGFVRLAWKRRGEYAMGPGLWLGPFAALLVAHWPG